MQWDCVWECWVPYCGHFIEVTFHSKWAWGEELRATHLLQKSKRVNQSCSIRRKKTAIGWILKQLLGCIALGSPERKMWILPPRFGIQVDTQGVYPQDPRMLQIYLGLLDLSYRGNVMQQTFERCFDSPCECGTCPYDHSLWGYCHWKMNSK